MAIRRSILFSILCGLLVSPQVASGQDTLWRTMMESADKSIAAHDYAQAQKQLVSALTAVADEKNNANLRLTIRKLASVYRLLGQNIQAEAILQRLITSESKNSDSVDTADDLVALASVHQQLSKQQESEREFKRALEIYEKRSAPVPQIVGALENLAILYEDSSKYGHAEESLKRALVLAEKSGDVKLTAQLFDKLGSLYTRQNRFAEAEPLLQKSLSLKESLAGTVFSGVELGKELSNLGKLYREQGNFTQAETYLKRALALHEREDSADPAVATAMMELGDLYRVQYRESQAIPLYEKAIAICEARYGSQSSQVAEAKRKLADALSALDKYERAETLYKQVLASDEAASGKESREAANDLSNLALLYLNQGRYADAEPLYKQALAIVQKQAGEAHPDTATCLNNLAFLARNRGQLTEADACARQGLSIRQRVFGDEHPVVARNMANLAEIEMLSHNWSAAETLLRRAIEIEKTTLDLLHPDIAVNMRDLATTLEAQKKWSEAESLYKQLLTLDAKTEVSDAVVASDMDGLARALFAQDKNDEAKPIANKALYLKEKLPGAIIASSGAEPLSSLDRRIATPSPRQIKDKWALVIGISNFQDSTLNLKFASKDATDFRNYLIQDAQFKPDHVKLLTDGNATRQNIVNNLGEGWLKRLAHPDDLVVIFISTHGSAARQQAGQANFIVPHDGNLENIVFNGIPMQWLTAGIKDLIHSDRVVLVLDVCHGGAVADGAKGIKRGDAEFDPAKIGAGDGQIILASSQADQISWESKKYPNSVFTRRLLEGLRSGGASTKIRDAFAYMKDKVEEEVLRDRAYLQTPLLVTKGWQGEDISLAVPAVKPRAGLDTAQLNVAAPAPQSAAAAVPKKSTTPTRSRK